MTDTGLTTDERLFASLALKATKDERMMAALAHISGLFGFGPLIAVIILVIKGKESRFIKYQAIQAIAYDLALLIGGFVLGFCWIAMFPLLMVSPGENSSAFPTGFMAIWCVVFGLGILTVVFRIIAAVRVYQGENFRYPFIGQLIWKEMHDQFIPPDSPID